MAPTAEQAEEDHANDRARGVDEDVGNHRGTSGDEHLVEFIGGGVEENDEDGDGGFAPTPGSRVAADGFANGAPKQQGEDGVFREVAAFANCVVDGVHERLRHVREEPVQERFDQT